MLGEGEDALDIELFEARVVELHLREGELLAELVTLARVDFLAHRSAVDVRLDEPVLALAA